MVSKHLGINSLKSSVINAKLSNLSELANILSVKSKIRANILALFSRFGIGHLLCHMSLEIPQDISAVLLILSLCHVPERWNNILFIIVKDRIKSRSLMKWLLKKHSRGMENFS